MHILTALAELPVGDLLAAGAIGGDATEASMANWFDNNSIGKMVQAVFWILGVVIVVFTVFGGVKAFLSGKMGDVAKRAIAGIIMAVFCFNLSLPFQLLDSGKDLVSNVFTTVDNDIISE